MLEYMNNEMNMTLTENGAVTYESTGSDCLDLFATIGAIRRESDEEIVALFVRAYTENADLAMKILFFAREIRGGLGERRVFRTIFKWMSLNEPQSVRYHEFLSKVTRGEATLHADNVAPYELVEPYLYTGWGWQDKCFMKSISAEEKQILNATWESLPDFGSNENALAVIDTSGSMYCGAKPIPAAVALSLGLYFAEHNTGAFKDCFIEFSAKPRLIKIKGDTFAERLRYVATFNEVANTNLEAVFEAILNAAVKNKVPQEELPAKLVIISDMEFDACVDNASDVIFKRAEKRFAEHGYKLPQIIFWNVASRNRQQPVKQNEQGVALISGATTRIFEMVAGGKLSPYTFMLEILEKERYAKIAA